jgi:UDP-glucose 4-epimerase
MFQANFLGKITINGSGDQHRSFIHVDKVAHAIVHVVDGKLTPGTYNVVEYNLSINDVVDTIKRIYPTLDTIHANYNIRMKDVITAVPGAIWDSIPLPVRTFEEELVDFKQHFSF